MNEPGAYFATATEQLECGTPVVSVLGEVDLASAPSFEQKLLHVAERRAGRVIVDLTACSFFDSKGLQALLAIRLHLNRSNREMALVVSDPNVLKIFQVTGFDTLFEIHPSLADAAYASANGNGNGNGNENGHV
jgi:anti-sigma B factor antagonist